jgi:hypothetical protein
MKGQGGQGLDERDMGEYVAWSWAQVATGVPANLGVGGNKSVAPPLPPRGWRSSDGRDDLTVSHPARMTG